MKKNKVLPQSKEGDLYITIEGLPNDNESIGNDFALLANCNQTIDSHSSFSFFARAFAGGFKLSSQTISKNIGIRNSEILNFRTTTRSTIYHPD